MKVVNVVSQQQWDCVSKELGYEWWFSSWNNFKEKTCINIEEIGCNYVEWYKEQKATIITFEQWVLEHCREKHKGNPIVKSLYNDLSASIDSNSLWIQGIVGVMAKTNANDKIALTLFDFDTYQFATIIEKSIEQQPDLLAIAKEKYPIGTKVKCLFEFNDCVVSGYDVFHPGITNNIDDEGNVWFEDSGNDENIMVYRASTKEWAEIIASVPEKWTPKIGEFIEAIDECVTSDNEKSLIIGKKYKIDNVGTEDLLIHSEGNIRHTFSLKNITKYFKPCSQPAQRKVIGYAAPSDLYGGEVKKGEVFTKASVRLNLYGIDKQKGGHHHCIPAELVEAFFTPIYAKTEADEQAEMCYELISDFITHSDGISLETYAKQQTKFKIVRNEN